MLRLGICTIATNVYVPYAKTLIESFIRHAPDDVQTSFFVFTNHPEEFRIPSDRGVNVIPVETPNYVWPEATLRRFEHISEISSSDSLDCVLWIDADSIVEAPFDENLLRSIQKTIALVPHAGFFRGSKFVERIKNYVASPSLLIFDPLTYLRFGGLGSWETRRNSPAFVARKLRKVYFAGGVWGGPSRQMRNLCNELANAVKLNLDRIPIFHDESYLNEWATRNQHVALDPSYCYVDSLPYLRNLKPIISAVKKEQRTR